MLVLNEANGREQFFNAVRNAEINNIGTIMSNFMLASAENFELVLNIFAEAEFVSLYDKEITVRFRGPENGLIFTSDCVMFQSIFEQLVTAVDFLVVENDVTNDDLLKWIFEGVQVLHFVGPVTNSKIKDLQKVDGLRMLTFTVLSDCQLRDVLRVPCDIFRITIDLEDFFKCMKPRFLASDVVNIIFSEACEFSSIAVKSFHGTHRWIIDIASKISEFYKVISKSFPDLRYLAAEFLTIDCGAWRAVYNQFMLVQHEVFVKYCIANDLEGYITFASYHLEGFEDAVRAIHDMEGFVVDRDMRHRIIKKIQITQKFFLSYEMRFSAPGIENGPVVANYILEE